MPVGTTLEDYMEETPDTSQQQAQKGSQNTVVGTATTQNKAPKGTMEAVLGNVTTADEKQTTSTDVEQSGVTTSTDSQQQSPGTSTDNPFEGIDNNIAILQKARDRYTPETDDEREARERREKASRKISAISDGIRALSNLYFTSQYAPNMYNHEKDSQLAKVDARQEKLKAEREANHDKFLNYSLKIGDLQNDKAKTLRELEANAEKMKLAREAAARAVEKHGWEAALQPDKARKAVADADAAESKATTAKAEADNAGELYKAKVNTEQQRAKSEQARQNASNASAANSLASAAAHGRNSQGEYEATYNGKTRYFKTAKARNDWASNPSHYCYEDWMAEEETDETTTPVTDRRGNVKVDANGKPITKTVIKTARKSGRPAAGDNTPPSRRGNNDNTPPSRR